MGASLLSDQPTAQLHSAILVYQSNGRPVYASIHGIGRDAKDALVIEEGTAASRTALASLLRGLVGVDGVEFLSHKILVRADGVLAFWVPPERRHVWFNCQELGARTASVPLPGFIFLVTANEWYVWAVKGMSRPDKDAALFVAPFFNVWRGGRICTGSVKRPAGDCYGQPEAWEEAFFRSYFTHPNVHESKGLTLHRHGIYAFWKALLDGKFKKFPERLLVPMEMTAEAGIKTVLGQANARDR